MFQREVADFFFFFPLSLRVCALIVLSVATLMTHRGSLFSVFPAAARSDKFSLIFLTTFITAATSAAVPVLWVLSPPRPLSLPSMPSIIPHPPPDVFFTLSPTSRPRRLDVVSEHLNSQEPRITLNSSDVGATLDSERKGTAQCGDRFSCRSWVDLVYLANQSVMRPINLTNLIGRHFFLSVKLICHGYCSVSILPTARSHRPLVVYNCVEILWTLWVHLRVKHTGEGWSEELLGV